MSRLPKTKSEICSKNEWNTVEHVKVVISEFAFVNLLLIRKAHKSSPTDAILKAKWAVVEAKIAFG